MLMVQHGKKVMNVQCAGSRDSRLCSLAVARLFLAFRDSSFGAFRVHARCRSPSPQPHAHPPAPPAPHPRSPAGSRPARAPQQPPQSTAPSGRVACMKTAPLFCFSCVARDGGNAQSWVEHGTQHIQTLTRRRISLHDARRLARARHARPIDVLKKRYIALAWPSASRPPRWLSPFNWPRSRGAVLEA